MKLGGKNIITGDDITLVGSNKTLTQKLSEIDELKANVKFIYKHGTLGGGSGGSGGGLSTKWKVVVRFDKGSGYELINPNTKLQLSSPGKYNVKVEIFGGSSYSFKIDFEYEKGSKASERANIDNSFSVSRTVDLQTSGNLNIIVTNIDTGEYYTTLDSSGTEIPYITFPYITSLYKFSTPFFVKDDSLDVIDVQNKIYRPEEDSIFMSDVSTTGLVLGFDFIVSSNIISGSCTVTYTDWAGYKYAIPGDFLGITSNSSGTILLPLLGDHKFDDYIINKTSDYPDIHEYLNNNGNAGLKQLELYIEFQLEGSLTPEPIIVNVLKNNLIPNNLYLKIVNETGKLFNQDTSYETVLNCNTNDKMLVGDCVFNVIPYCGSKDKTRLYRLNITVWDWENGEEFINEQTFGEFQPSDQTPKQINIGLYTKGVKKITFNMTTPDKIGETYIATYFLNIKDITSDFTWFTNKDLTYDASYKKGLDEEGSNKNIYGPNNEQLSFSSSIEMNANMMPQTYKINNINNLTIENFDQFISVGIQYSQTNNTEIPIFSLNAVIPGRTPINNIIESYSYFVYQNKIVKTTSQSIIDSNGNITIGSVDSNLSRELYIPIVDKIETTKYDNYHLLTIYKNFEVYDKNTNYKGVYAFIDGEYDSVLPGFDTKHHTFNSITFYPGNYSINLLEIANFEHTIDSTLKTKVENDSEVSYYDYLQTSDIEKYYYTYYEKMIIRGDDDKRIPDNEIKLVDYFSQFTYDEESKMVKCLASSANNIAQNINVPVLVLNYTDDLSGIGPGEGWKDPDKDNFITWLSKYYQQDEPTGQNVNVTLYYSSGRQELKEIKINNIAAQFYINIQGSTTKALFAKNLELYAPVAPTGSVYVFSPNITQTEDPEKFKQMLLPEKSFTLKADVVDSSHTNNNAIGNFVNDNLTPFINAKNKENHKSGDKYVAEKYLNKIRNCLSGFPILIFLNTTLTHGKTDEQEWDHNYYYLGVYNFNLGRNSSFNLGYNNLSAISNAIETQTTGEGFNIYEIPEDNIHIISGLMVSEVQNNNTYFDFSQYDPSILYKFENAPSDPIYMWDDFVYGGTEAAQKAALTRLCESIAKTGGYIFKTIGKIMPEGGEYGYDTGYSAKDIDGTPKNQVPNFFGHAKRVYNNGFKYEFTRLDITDNELGIIFKNTLSEAVDESGVTNIPIIDYRSISEYYTTCMALGLVDSVEKNMNIKSWTTVSENSPGTFYVSFYDMDTGLGITNSGTRMSYFAFSDYWLSNTTRNEDGTYDLDEVKVYRDYAPVGSTDGETFFDIPSSYLFAIPKYALQILARSKSGDYEQGYERLVENNPATIWARWRNTDGCLRNAKYFMDTYFSKHLKDIPHCAINWNYKYKYFVKNNNKTGFDDANYIKFYGNKKAYTENWLNGRLHIMDAYMNINGLTEQLNPGKTPEYFANVPNAGTYRGDNPDVFINKELFSEYTSPVIKYDGLGSQGNVQISATPYAPLIIQTQASVQKYLFPKYSDNCNLYINLGTGQPQALFGGSRAWMTLSSINNFISPNEGLTIISDYFTNLVGTERACSKWNLNTPALKTIYLNSANYSGDLEFKGKENYPNLNIIDISNTHIQLLVEGIDIYKLTALNMRTGSSISCKETYNLSDVQISGTLGNIDIYSWKKNITLPTNASDTLNCQKINLTNNKFDDASVEITNNTTLTTLNLHNYSHIKISGCINLTTITISQDNAHSLKSLEIIMSNNSSTSRLSLNSTDNCIDLSEFTELESLKIQRGKFTKIILPNNSNLNINLNAGALAYNNKLQYIDGNAKLYIKGDSVFRDCNEFTLLKNDSSNELANIYIDPNCTSLANTFLISDNAFKGKITHDVASRFLSERCTESAVGKVTKINSMFQNQSISYSIKKGLTEYNNNRCSLSLESFKKVNSFSQVFYYNDICFYNRYMFGGNFGKNQTSFAFSRPLCNKSMTWVACTYDFLYEVINKITSLSINHEPTKTTYLCVVNPTNYESLPDDNTVTVADLVSKNIAINTDDVKISNLFNFGDDNKFNLEDDNKYPNLLTSISSFELVSSGNNIKYDFTEIFNSNWTSANSSGLSISDTFWRKNYIIQDYTKIDELFKYVKLKSVSMFLPSVTPLDISVYDSVDLYNFINWDNLSVTTNLFYNSEHNSILFPKHITYDNFKNIWNRLVRTTNLTSIGFLFYNCTITTTNILNDFVLASTDNINKKITATSNLFNRMKLTLNDDEQYIPLTWHTLKCIPNIKIAKAMFANIKIKYPISFDFFHKRYYVKVDKFVTDDGSKTASLYMYSYNKTISDMQSCFANVQLQNPTAFNSEGYHDNDKIIDYNNGQIIKNYLEDSEGNTYDKYYDIIEDLEEHIVIEHDLTTEQPSEILDIEKAEQPEYTTYTTGFYGDYKNIQKYDTNPGMFIAPDIFYGCTNDCIITSCFSNGSQTNYNIVVFTGTIPEHLLYSEGHSSEMNLRNVSITNLLTGLNIKPILIHTSTETDTEGIEIKSSYYVFVPSNFTNYVSLDSVFNFRLLLPQSSENDQKYFYLFNKDSISKNTVTLANSIPKSTYSESFGRDNLGWPDYSSASYKNSKTPAHYNLMINIIENNDNNGNITYNIIEGLDLSYLSKLKLNDIFTNDNYILRVMSGNLFRDNNIAWKTSYLDNYSSSYFISYTTARSGLSAHLKLPLPKNNNHFIHIIKYSDHALRINMNSITNFTNDVIPNIDRYKTDWYTPITFVEYNS